MGRRKQKDLRNGISSASSKSSEETKLTQLVDNLLRVTTAPVQPNVNKALELQSQITEIVKQIQALENSKDEVTCPSFRSDGATIHKFLNWLQENGAEFEGIQIANFPGYEMGLQASKDLKESSLIISIPRKIMLTTESVSGTSLESLIQKDALLNNMSNVALTLVLLFEKFKDESFWKPYIDILPVTYSTVLYFTNDELKELKGSLVLETALKQIRNICRQYAYLHKMIWTSDNPTCKLLKKYFTFNQYRWAASTVMTRQNTVPSEDGNCHIISALIPLWDLCNHMNGSITTDYNPELRRSECFALKDFKQNDQIFIFYGARNNADLFIHNGFVYEDNIHDGYWLKLGISKNDPLREKRIQLLEKLSINNFDFWIRKGPEPIDSDLLAFLRVFNMDHGTYSSVYKMTIGADFAIKSLMVDESTLVHLQLWDIAGNERFGSLTRVYYKYAVAAAIVFDLTRPETFNSVKNWLSDLRRKVTLQNEQPLPVIILANKGDVNCYNIPNEIVDFCKEQNILDWFITSAKENTNIEAAFERLIQAALHNYNDDKSNTNDNIISLKNESKKNSESCCT